MVAPQVVQVPIYLLEFKAFPSGPFWEQSNKTALKTHGKWFLIYIGVAVLTAIDEATSVLDMKEHFRKQAAIARVFGQPDQLRATEK